MCIIQSEIEAAFTEARPRLLRLAALRGIAPTFLEDIVQESLFCGLWVVGVAALAWSNCHIRNARIKR